MHLSSLSKNGSIKAIWNDKFDKKRYDALDKMVHFIKFSVYFQYKSVYLSFLSKLYPKFGSKRIISILYR